jgi:hypothetical protein
MLWPPSMSGVTLPEVMNCRILTRLHVVANGQNSWFARLRPYAERRWPASCLSSVAGF